MDLNSDPTFMTSEGILDNPILSLFLICKMVDLELLISSGQGVPDSIYDLIKQFSQVVSNLAGVKSN